MKSWDKQKYESQTRFEFFTNYRDSGNSRNIKSTADALKITENRLAAIAECGQWKNRVDDYDKYIESLLLKKMKVKKNKVNENDLLKTKNALDKIFTLISNRIENQDNSSNIKTPDLIRLISYLSKTKAELHSTKRTSKNREIFISFAKIAKILQTDSKCLELSCELLKRYNEIKKETSRNDCQ